MARLNLRISTTILCAAVSNVVVAAVGDIDTSFGDHGSATISVISLVGFFPSKPIVQSDGKILVCGAELTTYPYLESSFLYRFSADGVLDADFGEGGRAFVTYDIDACDNIGLQPDGKIVVSGATFVDGDTADLQTDVLRFDSDGRLDTTFGADGVVDVNLLPDEWDNAVRMVVGQDGSIVLGIPLDPSSLGIARLRNDGSLDETFGGVGHVAITFPDSTDRDLGALLFDDEGRLTVVGSVTLLSGAQRRVVVAARLLTDGTLDASFGDGGLATFLLSDDTSAHDAARGPDGSTLIAGAFEAGDQTQIALIRMTSEGSLDTSFANSGSRVLSINGINDTAFDLLPRRDGTWMLSGVTEIAQSAREGFLLSLDANANPITSFGINGARTYAAPDNDNYFIGLAAQNDDFIVYGFSVYRTGPVDTYYLTRMEGNGSLAVRGHSRHQRVPRALH